LIGKKVFLWRGNKQPGADLASKVRGGAISVIFGS